MHAEPSLWHTGNEMGRKVKQFEQFERIGYEETLWKYALGWVVVEQVKRWMRQKNLSGSLRYSESGGRDKHKHIYSTLIQLSFCSLLCGFTSSLLHISKKILTEFGEILRVKFTNRICTWVKLEKYNTLLKSYPLIFLNMGYCISSFLKTVSVLNLFTSHLGKLLVFVCEEIWTWRVVTIL